MLTLQMGRSHLGHIIGGREIPDTLYEIPDVCSLTKYITMKLKKNI